MEANENQGSLLRKTRELLNETKMSYLDIFKATGLPPNWLTGIATGKINDPSVNRVQALYECLRGKALTL